MFFRALVMILILPVLFITLEVEGALKGEFNAGHPILPNSCIHGQVDRAFDSSICFVHLI